MRPDARCIPLNGIVHLQRGWSRLEGRPMFKMVDTPITIKPTRIRGAVPGVRTA